MPTLAVTNFNIVCAVLGGFVTLFGLVSYLVKEKFYLSEALVSTLAGIVFSPHATNFIKPLDYAGSQANLDSITLYFSRLVLGIQLVIAGVQLPSKYLRKEWRPLSILLGPIMTSMWLAASLIVWGMVPHINILQALAVGACVTPTDPVLSNSIVKGKFADKNVPKDLQKIIIAESGANDGLGYPFLFLPLYLMKCTGEGGAGQSGGAGEAMRLWFGETWGYTILLSVVYGATAGWIAKDLLYWAEEKRFVDRESFLVFAITLALFIVGTCGMIGSDDVLACFIAGNTFSWDDSYRLDTLDDSLQPTIDMLLNLSVFMWFGAICPWALFRTNNVIPLYRLIPLGVLILLFRRLPFVFALHKYIWPIEAKRQAIFMGFFGPIGVSAVFYLYISLEFLDTLTVNGVQREDARHLAEVMNVVVWFLAICSIVVHGLSIPLGKLGFYLPRTLSQSLNTSRNDEPEPFHIREHVEDEIDVLRNRRHSRHQHTHSGSSGTSTPDRADHSTVTSTNTSRRLLYPIGGSIIPDRTAWNTVSNSGAQTPTEVAMPNRTIRFPDDAPRSSPALSGAQSGTPSRINLVSPELATHRVSEERGRKASGLSKSGQNAAQENGSGNLEVPGKPASMQAKGYPKLPKLSPYPTQSKSAEDVEKSEGSTEPVGQVGSEVESGESSKASVGASGEETSKGTED